MQATEYFNVGRWANFGRRRTPLPPSHRPKWGRDDGQSIKTFDRSHYEFRLILHRRLITHTHDAWSWNFGAAVDTYSFTRAHISHSGKGLQRTVSVEMERAMADDALAENGAISRDHKRKIDYGNIFSVEAKVKQHTSSLSLSLHEDIRTVMICGATANDAPSGKSRLFWT